MLKHKDLQIFSLKVKNVSNIHPIEVVGRGSKRQFQVGKIFNKLTDKGLI